MVELKKHQKLPIKFIKNNFGLILYHSTGSGKTITSLISMKQFVDKDGRDVVIIGPKSSKKAFNDEIKKLGYSTEKFQLYTYQKIKAIIQNNVEFFKNKCIILDEAHHLRNETRDNMFLSSTLTLAHRIMLLTATPIVNYLNDIAPLVNIAKKCDSLPTKRDLFNFFYFDEDKLEIQNKHLLLDKLKGCISYYEKLDDEDYPQTETIIREVEMTVEQVDKYSEYIKKFLYDDYVPPNIDLLDVDFEFLSKKRKNSFLSATRQISNTVNGDTKSFKLNAILKEIQKGSFPVIIYSNYLENGIYTMAKILNAEGISFKLITGSTNDDKIVNIVNDYNSRKFDVLLLSSAGSESLDLKNTRQVHIMEPHWNEARINQVIGRAVRYKSHDNLSDKNKKVKIFRWISIFPEPYTNLSADQYLTQISQKKKEIFEAFKDILIQASIEKNMQSGGFYLKYLDYKQRYIDIKRRNF